VGFAGHFGPHIRRIGHRFTNSWLQGQQIQFKNKGNQSPMLESLSLTARQRAMVDSAADDVPIDRAEKFQKYVTKTGSRGTQTHERATAIAANARTQ
jgi:hypothetical protein